MGNPTASLAASSVPSNASVFAARKLLQQLDERDACASFWMLCAVDRLARECPTMSLGQLLAIAVDAMPEAARAFDEIKTDEANHGGPQFGPDDMQSLFTMGREVFAAALAGRPVEELVPTAPLVQFERDSSSN